MLYQDLYINICIVLYQDLYINICIVLYQESTQQHLDEYYTKIYTQQYSLLSQTGKQKQETRGGHRD